jgi:thymidine kinase
MFKKMLAVAMLIHVPLSFAMGGLASPNLSSSDFELSSHKGVLTGITGPMASGKTLALLLFIDRFGYQKKSTLICKNALDSRSNIYLKSRMGFEIDIPAQLIKEPDEILDLAKKDKYDAVVIDETQFFSDDSMTPVVQKLIDLEISVVFSGLDKDFRGLPFGYREKVPSCMPSLLAMADVVHKYAAVCHCGKDATMTQRLVSGRPAHRGDPLVIVDGTAKEVTYEPRCRNCFELLD